MAGIRFDMAWLEKGEGKGEWEEEGGGESGWG